MVSSTGCGASSEALAFLWLGLVRTLVYVDGFNFYYGALKDSSLKWLDLLLLFQRVLPQHLDVRQIKYFTARISGTPQDQSKPVRQSVYIRALQAFRPEVSVYFGRFQSHAVHMPLEHPSPGRRTVRVIKTEEKGSDVNLAVHLLNDAWLDAYECAVIVSNDSDLAEAMSLVKEHHGAKQLGLVTPRSSSWSQQLRKHADFVRQIRTGALRDSQLPDPIPGTKIRKPVGW